MTRPVQPLPLNHLNEGTTSFKGAPCRPLLMRIVVTSECVSDFEGHATSATAGALGSFPLDGKKMGNVSGIGKLERVSSVTISRLPGIT